MKLHDIKQKNRQVKLLLVLNSVTLLAAVYLAVFQPLLTDVDVRTRYIQLDRAGAIAINQEVLTDFHPGYRFSDGGERNTVPRYIAQPALAKQRFNAFLLLGLALVNATVIVFVRKNIVIVKQPRHDNMNTIETQL